MEYGSPDGVEVSFPVGPFSGGGVMKVKTSIKAGQSTAAVLD
jgi:hypothetical protein